MISRGIFTAAMILAGGLVGPAVSWACSVCGLDDSAYIVSYLFLTGMPFAITALVGGVFVYSIRRKKDKSSDA